MKEQYYKIKNYIKNTYNIPVEETKDYFNNYILLLKAEKYDVKIGINKPSKNHFLYGKTKYILELEYDANKKYRNELCYHGGGRDVKYTEDNYEIIDDFLKEWFKKSNKIQLTIFNI